MIRIRKFHQYRTEDMSGNAEALAAQLEAEAMSDMFNKMVDSCHNKCIGTLMCENFTNIITHISLV